MPCHEGVTNGDSYLHINEYMPCFADKDTYDNDNIVEEISSKRIQVEESPTTKDDDEDDDKMILLTDAIARHSAQLLQHCLAWF